MGVKGLWQLIGPSGSPVTLESLENKVLAVDISIWLHQSVRGFKGVGPESVANSHILTLFNRICKLLFYRIRPIFVFDGGVPILKKQTLSARRLKREAAASKAQRVRDRLLDNLLKSDAVRRALGKKGPAPSAHRVLKPVKKTQDMYELPPLEKPLLPCKESASCLEDSDEEDPYHSKFFKKNLHTFEFDDTDFKSLPLQKQHEILSELQITRKENSWNTMNEMPQELGNFSSFQLERLLKRKEFQNKLDSISAKIEKTHTTEMENQIFSDLEKYVSHTNRIISEDSSHSIYLKNKLEKPAIEKIVEDVVPVQQKSKGKLARKDFLSELARQGIVREVTPDEQRASAESTDLDSFDSDSDEEGSPSIEKKRRIDEEAFLKVVDYVLDDNELNQDEIMALIQQSRKEIDEEYSPKDSGSQMKEFDEGGPSTSKSAVGIIYNSDAESSTDDEDFIDVPLEESSDANDSEENNTNENAILNAKYESPFLKISQQKIVSPSKHNVAFADSRVNKNIKPDGNCSQNSNLKNVIPIDISNIASISKPDDIFSDILMNKNSIPIIDKADEKIGKSNNDMPDESKYQVLDEMSNEECETSKKIISNENKLILTHRNDGLTNSKNLSNVFDKSVACNLETDKLTDVKSTKTDFQTSTDTARDMKTKNSENIKDPNKFPTETEPIENKNVILQENIEKDERNICDSRPDATLEKEPHVLNDNIEEEMDSQTDTKKKEIPATDRNIEVSTRVIKAPIKYSEQDLEKMEVELVKEQENLVKEVYSADRIAADMSNQVYGEAQELLQLFGLPYIVAPMEAEAQCAFLNMIGLSQGSITDDSDVFLFGGKTVYKNFFNHSKHVECFNIDNIFHNFGLDRNKMISLALLTGSDYTVGIESVGGVLGMEILAEFPGNDIESLKSFKKWWKSASKNITSMGLSKTKQRLLNLYLPESFPNENIYKAYINPDVDESREKFSWAIPNAEKLKTFASEKLGWSFSKTSEMLIPVLKKLGMKDNQMRIDSYFSSIRLVKESDNRSKRLQEAIDRSKGKTPNSKNSLLPTKNAEKKKQGKKRKNIEDSLTDSSNSEISKEYAAQNSKSKGSHNKTSSNIQKIPQIPDSDLNLSQVSESDIHNESQYKKGLTKTEKKQNNFKKLLEKDKILQAEKDKQDMAKKKAEAALLLSKLKSNNKSNIRSRRK